jgi:hypothetical protein
MEWGVDGSVVRDECMYRVVGYVHMWVKDDGLGDYVGRPVLPPLALP